MVLSSEISILVIEDVDAMRELVRQVLDGVPGLRVSGVAANGWEARLELSKRRPALILMDEILPGESSIDLLEEFALQGLPVLLMTGMENPAHPIPAKACGRVRKPEWDTITADRLRLKYEIETVFSR
jgi:DNA-binding NarL/FixJ family response regulator